MPGTSGGAPDHTPDHAPRTLHPATATRSNTQRLGQLIGGVVLIVILIAIALPQVWNPFSRDHGELGSCVQRLIHNASVGQSAVIYKDCWENKGPLTYPFYVVPIVLSPTILSLRLFDVIWQALTSLVLIWVVARMAAPLPRYKQIAVLAGIAYWALYVTSGFWNTAQSESYAALFLLLNIYFAWRLQPNALAGPLARSLTGPFLAGLFGGVVFLLKYTFVLMPLGTGALMLLQIWLAGRNGRWVIKSALAYALGVLLVTACVAAYFVLSDALPAFMRHLDFASGSFAVRRPLAATLDIVWINLRDYMSHGVHLGPVGKVTVPEWNVLGYGFPILIALALFAVWRHRRDRSLRVWYFAVAWLMGYLNIVWQARFTHYHTMVLLLPLVVTAAFALVPVTPSPPESINTQASDTGLPRFAYGLAIAAVIISQIPSVLDWHSNVIVQGKSPLDTYRDTTMNDEMTLHDWVLGHTTPEDRIAIWGLASSVYFITGRQNATRFFSVLPFEYQSAYRDFWMNQYVEDMTATQPKYFILTKDNYPTPGYSAEAALRNAGPINTYIESHYNYIGESTVFLLYERK